MSLGSPRQQYIKNLLNRNKNQVNEIRNLNRQNLINRLKHLRIRNVDRFRNLHDNVSIESLMEIRKLLQTENEWESEQERFAFLEKLEEELTLMAAEEHERQCQLEVEAVTEMVPHCCLFCEVPINQGDICEFCLINT